MYFIIEHDKKDDGTVNVSETVRSTFASALSYYYERISKMCVTELFTSVAVMLVDEDLNVIEQKAVNTLWKPSL